MSTSEKPADSSTPPGLPHFNAAGQAYMVDVSAKAGTHRVSIASVSIHMKPETLAIMQAGTTMKGDVLGVAA